MISRISLSCVKNLDHPAECCAGAVRFLKLDLSVRKLIVHLRIKSLFVHFMVYEEMNQQAEAITAEKMTAPK